MEGREGHRHGQTFGLLGKTFCMPNIITPSLPSHLVTTSPAPPANHLRQCLSELLRSLVTYTLTYTLTRLLSVESRQPECLNFLWQ